MKETERDINEWYNQLNEDSVNNPENAWCYGIPEKEHEVELSLTYDPDYLRTSWCTYLAYHPDKFVERLEKVQQDNPEFAEEIVNHPEYHVWEGCMGHAIAICAGKLTSQHLESQPPYSTIIKDFPQERAIEILKLLLECGLDLSIKNAYGYTAYEHLQQKGGLVKRVQNEKFMEYLKKETEIQFIDKGLLPPPLYEEYETTDISETSLLLTTSKYY